MQSVSNVATRRWLLTMSALCLGACSSEGEPHRAVNPQLSFPTPTAEELQSVEQEWAQRDLSSRETELANEDTVPIDYDVQIFRHRVGTNTHYGAVAIPKNAMPGTVPVVVHADGLDQQNPPLNLDENLQMAGALLQAVVYVVPTFRGRTLIYKGVSYPADGDFCDAYDGAADDAIAFLSVVAEQVPAANMQRVMVRGGSRGGNTALLMAVRDIRIKVALAIAAPVDFNRLEIRTRYGAQFRCQFTDNKTSEASRSRVLASSPLHFPIQPSVRKIFLFHGSADEVVPVWNATEMAARLEAQGVTTELKIFEGYGHQDLGSAPDFRSAQRAAFAELFTME